MAASKTFFEQIPVETVKRIAKEFPEEKAIVSDGENTEMPDDVRSPRESWVAWHKSFNTGGIQKE